MNEEKARYEQVRNKILVMEAWAEGKEIEYNVCDIYGKTKWLREPNPTWNWDYIIYRVKPEPKIIPFNKDTMPFPCVIRNLDVNANEYLTLAKSELGVSMGVSNQLYRYATLASDFEYRNIGSMTWQPCYTKVG